MSDGDEVDSRAAHGDAALGDKGASRPAIKVDDRRHWARDAEAGPDGDAEEAEPPSLRPTVVDEYQKRAEAAETKLLEYISAFKQAQSEQEEFRARLSRDVERRVELQFGAVVAELLDTVDDLDLALSHLPDAPAVAPLAKGVELARDRFLATLERHGVERMDLEGTEFHPNVAEAVRVDEAASPEDDGKVVAVLRPGYRLGERVLRPARVAVGKHRAR